MPLLDKDADYVGCTCIPHSLTCLHCSACSGHLFTCPVSDPYRWVQSSSAASQAEARRWIGRLANLSDTARDRVLANEGLLR